MSSESIYLASKSPRRQELLTQIGVEYQLVSVDVPEQRNPGESPADYVQRLSLDKARAGALAHNDRPVLGADTIVVLGEDVLEKPESPEHGQAMLRRLSGNTHQVMTAVSVVFEGRELTSMNTSSVRFRAISDDEIARYWDSGEPADKAGGYGIQGLGAVFVESLAGSYSGVVGLPLFETSGLLQQWGIHTP